MDLATLIDDAATRAGLSNRDVEHEAERHGERVSFSTVSKIRNGSYAHPGERILRGLSMALNIPMERLREAAGNPEPGTPFRLPPYASRLSPAERSAVEHLVRVMVDAKDERSGEHADSSAATSTGPDEDSGATMDDYGLAAHPEQDQSHSQPWEEQGL